MVSVRKRLMLSHSLMLSFSSTTTICIEAIEAGEVFPLHGPLTHECIHIIEVRTDQHLISGFDHKRYHDTVSLAVLEEFIARIGREEFMRRYLP